MMNLTEYQASPQTLADYLPWACLIAPGVILNKDGSFQRTAEFRGPDLDSSTSEELVSICARINNALKRFGSSWLFTLKRPAHLHLIIRQVIGATRLHG